ncbi:hypothetical protein OH77DRAFT_407262 [Trametes cingulata]|nr:hypothetical protein OH77DRAFT_407262 [Trametes cingulata]
MQMRGALYTLPLHRWLFPGRCVPPEDERPMTAQTHSHWPMTSRDATRSASRGPCFRIFSIVCSLSLPLLHSRWPPCLYHDALARDVRLEHFAVILVPRSLSILATILQGGPASPRSTRAGVDIPDVVRLECNSSPKFVFTFIGPGE